MPFPTGEFRAEVPDGPSAPVMSNPAADTIAAFDHAIARHRVLNRWFSLPTLPEMPGRDHAFAATHWSCDD